MGSRPSRWVHDQDRPGIRHRGGIPWYAAQIPRRWHFCQPQTIELRRVNGLLIGTYHCACGALTDRTGRWVGCNSRRYTPDPAGLRRDPETPQPVRTRAASGIVPHPGTRRHPRPTKLINPSLTVVGTEPTHIRADRVLLADLTRMNSGVVPLAMRITDDSSTVDEQRTFADRLIELGTRQPPSPPDRTGHRRRYFHGRTRRAARKP